jgi:hypothetical protein
MFARLKYLWACFWLFADRWPTRKVGMPDWTDADAKALQCFLATASGRNLVACMEQIEQWQNRQAVIAGRGDRHTTGYAAGWHGALTWIETLSRTQPAHDAENKQQIGVGAAELAERLAP